MEIKIDVSEIKKDKVLFERVINALVAEMEPNIEVGCKEWLEHFLHEKYSSLVKETLSEKIDALLDTEFQPVSDYYEKKPKTTLRNQIIGQIKGELLYKVMNWDNDRNKFTAAVEKILRENIAEFTKEQKKSIDEKFLKLCTEEAMKNLSKVLKATT